MIAAAAVTMAAVTPDDEITATRLFIEAPKSVVLIDSFPKLEMLEYFRAGSDHATSTLVGSSSTIREESPEKLAYDVSSTASYEIVLLPGKGGRKVVGVIETLSPSVTDSNIRFFNTDWTPYTGKKAFSEPMFDDWLTPEGKAERQSLMDDMPFITAKYEYSPDSGTLTASLTMEKYYTPDDWKKFSPLLKPTLIYKWNSKTGAFELQKK